MLRSPLTFIVALLLVCAGAAAWHKASQNSARGGMSLPAGASLSVLSPVGRALNGTGAWASDVGRTVFRRGSITEENEQLRERVADLQEQNARLQSLDSENRQLRSLLKLPTPGGGQSLAASVVAYDSTDTSRQIVLNVGARQGVRVKDVVFAAEGVAGQVSSVSAAVCTVLLLPDLRSSIGALTGRTRAPGVVKGQGEALCRMAYLPDGADVREGDEVLTRIMDGKGRIYPAGMLIGRVVRVSKNKALSQTEALIAPAVNFAQLRAVRVRIAAS